MKCKGCGFPFPPHELREEHCFECCFKHKCMIEAARQHLEDRLDEVKQDMERVEKQAAAMLESLRVIEHACAIRESSGIIETKLVLDEIRATRSNLNQI